MMMVTKESRLDRNIVVFHAEDLPSRDMSCGFSIYRNVLVQWDEDGDGRILDFIDSLSERAREQLLIAWEHKATLTLRWKIGCAPPGYRKFDEVEVLADSWEVRSSLGTERAISTSR